MFFFIKFCSNLFLQILNKTIFFFKLFFINLFYMLPFNKIFWFYKWAYSIDALSENISDKFYVGLMYKVHEDWSWFNEYMMFAYVDWWETRRKQINFRNIFSDQLDLWFSLYTVEDNRKLVQYLLGRFYRFTGLCLSICIIFYELFEIYYDTVMFATYYFLNYLLILRGYSF